jgi:hypothetical protein
MFFNAVQIGVGQQPTSGAAASDLKGQGVLKLTQSLADLINKQDASA